MTELANGGLSVGAGETGSRRGLLLAVGASGLGGLLGLGGLRGAAAHGAEEVAEDAMAAVNAAMATGDEAGLDAMFAPDLVGHPPHRSLTTGEAYSHDLAGLKAALAEMRRYFPDGAFSVEDVVADDDRVAGRFTFRGTPDRAAFGMAEAASAPLEADGVVFAVIKDDRVSEFWAYFDVEEVMAVMALAGAATPAP